MIIAITSTGETLESQLDPRFGRAPKFIIYDTVEDSFKVIDNSINLSIAQGAGIQSAKNIVESGATVLIAGHCGPKAYKALKESSIEMYKSEEISIKEIIELYKAGKLELMQEEH